MKTLIMIGFFIAATYAQTIPDIVYTGPTPLAIECSHSLCDGKADGNYEHPTEKHHFMQCIGGYASCQPCWPENLYFSGKCNQCMYNYEDECYTSASWAPATTYECPDVCPDYGFEYFGNVNDPNNEYQYVACWYGATVGCIACPGSLKYNKQENACLYDGKYFTKPSYSYEGEGSPVEA